MSFSRLVNLFLIKFILENVYSQMLVDMKTVKILRGTVFGRHFWEQCVSKYVKYNKLAFLFEFYPPFMVYIYVMEKL